MIYSIESELIFREYYIPIHPQRSTQYDIFINVIVFFLLRVGIHINNTRIIRA